MEQPKLHRRIINWLAVFILLAPSIWFAYSRIAHASTLSFICANSSAATSTAACTGEQAGDMLLIMCGETTGGASPTLPSGVTAVTGAALTNSAGSTSTRTGMNVGWTTAASSSSGSGTCGSGTTDTVMLVYRGQGASPIGANVGTESGSNSGTSMIYNSDNLSVTDGSSWFAAFSLRNTADTQVGTAPTGMTNRTKVPTGTPAAAGFDLNGPTSSNWGSQTVSGFGASAKYTSIVLEIEASNPTVTVGSFGTLVSNLTQGTTANFTGGAFTLIREVGTANVTSIKVHSTDAGAQTDFANLILYYKQEAACESSFPSSGTTQFNSTVGSFNASSDSTVTGTISVGTTQVCIYMKMDVASGAGVGNTTALRITNPSTDVVVSAGVTAPSTNVTIGGTITIQASGPTTDQVMRGGGWFNNGSKQSFFWAN